MKNLKLKKGFTLVEVLIASLIFAQTTIIGTVTLTSVHRVTGNARIEQSKQQSARIAIEQIRREVRCVKVGETLSIDDARDKFTANNITFSTRSDYPIAGRETIVKEIGSNVYDMLPADTKLVGIDIRGRTGAVPDGKPYLYIMMSIQDIDSLSSPLQIETVVVPKGYQC